MKTGIFDRRENRDKDQEKKDKATDYILKCLENDGEKYLQELGLLGESEEEDSATRASNAQGAPDFKSGVGDLIKSAWRKHKGLPPKKKGKSTTRAKWSVNEMKDTVENFLLWL